MKIGDRVEISQGNFKSKKGFIIDTQRSLDNSILWYKVEFDPSAFKPPINNIFYWYERSSLKLILKYFNLQVLKRIFHEIK